MIRAWNAFIPHCWWWWLVIELRRDSILKIYNFIQYIIIYVPTPFGNQVCWMCTTTDVTSGFVWTWNFISHSDMSEESVLENKLLKICLKTLSNGTGGNCTVRIFAIFTFHIILLGCIIQREGSRQGYIWWKACRSWCEPLFEHCCELCMILFWN